jgi:hypothetical protein
MKKPLAETVPPTVQERNAPRVLGLALLASLGSFFYYFQHSDLLLYGDAVAHINIARRVVDSQTPGLLQLGTVWLPLPHLLMVPFLYFDRMWQSGAGGSIPSMVAYMLAVLGIFRLASGLLESDPRARPAASVGAWIAAVAYGANPNLLYMQATAMTESVYLAFFVWAVVYFAEFLRTRTSAVIEPKGTEPGALLARCGWCLAAAELTRYDGWILACAMGAIVAVLTLRHWNDRHSRLASLKFLLLIAAVPVLWLSYNAAIYGNALAFANGPYSAKAIEQRVGAPNPALHNAPIAAVYFLKSAQLNMADGNWGRGWLAAAVLVLIAAIWKLRLRSTPLLLLWVPLPFYALSIAYGSVPVHVYMWWPFATFNQRYGLQLLPMFAVSAGLLATGAFLLGAGRHGGKLVAATLALIVVSYASVWKAGPQCFQEARRNWQIRYPLNDSVERVVRALPRTSRYLMDLGEHVGVMEQAGIPLRQVVNNENHRPWKRPSDPDGLWERALANPARYVDFVITFEGDAVDQAVNKSNLTVLTEIHSTGQPAARIYSTRPISTLTSPNQPR